MKYPKVTALCAGLLFSNVTSPETKEKIETPECHYIDVSGQFRPRPHVSDALIAMTVVVRTATDDTCHINTLV